MDNTGWILTYRKIRDHWTWPDGEYSKLEAWLDLLFEAEYETVQTKKKGEVVEIERGEQLYSKRKLAEKWQWSRTKLNNFLNCFKLDKMIKIKKTGMYHFPIKIRICKYDLYQKKKSQLEVSEPQGVKSDFEDPKHQSRANKNTNKNTNTKTLEHQGVTPENQTPKTPIKKPIKKHNINIKNKEKEAITIIRICEIKKLWNKSKATKNIRKITNGRKQHISDLWESDILVNKSDWKELIKQIGASKYLQNQKWFDFDWIIKSEDNATKVLEGKYQDKPDNQFREGY